MTDREKLRLVLDNCSSNTIEGIFQCFLDNFEDDLSLRTVNRLRQQIGYCLDHKIEELNRARQEVIL